MGRSRSSVLRDAIEQDIVTGRFRPGERLDEATLARRFDVSRTPIREALQQLGAAGLLDVQPHRGAFVAAMSPTAVFEMLEVMAELEALCARLAARRAEAGQRAALVEAQQSCAAAARSADADAYYYENERFHHALYAASGNSFLAAQARALHTRLKPYRRLQLHVAGRVAASLDEHQAVVDAVLAGAPDAAAERARAHVLVQGERFSDFLAALAASDAEDGRRAASA